MERERHRYFLIDGIRGLAIVNMVAFHFLYDVFVIFEKNTSWYGLFPVRAWQQFICWTFIMISGAVWQWGGKRNLRRGLELNGWGLVISLTTWAAVPGEAVWFGILNFIGCAILLMFPLRRLLEEIPPLAGMLGSFVLFAVFRQVQDGFLGFGGAELLRLPEFLYTTHVLTPLGFPHPAFSSSDYFPLLPWMFLYLAGHFAGVLCMARDTWKHKARRHVPVLSEIGQRGIWVYLAHQPLCMLVCTLLFSDSI